MEVKLYVGNMAHDTTDEQLRALFRKAGNVVNIAVFKDRLAEAARGFAFITMSNIAGATKAITMYNGKDFGGQSLTVVATRPLEEQPADEWTSSRKPTNRKRISRNKHL